MFDIDKFGHFYDKANALFTQPFVQVDFRRIQVGRTYSSQLEFQTITNDHSQIEFITPNDWEQRDQIPGAKVAQSVQKSPQRCQISSLLGISIGFAKWP